MFDRTVSAGHLTNWAARLFARATERQLKPLGMLPGQLPIFLALTDGRALSQKALAGLAAIEQPSMAVNLIRMERDGLISRTPDPQDGRSSLIRLTPRALVKADEVRQVLKKGNTIALAGFSAEEKALFVALLRRVIDNLGGVLHPTGGKWSTRTVSALVEATSNDRKRK
ncbi:MAG: MarR family winged helix-turn-helix transcriptional regulator [Pseudoxanthomonas sp.]